MAQAVPIAPLPNTIPSSGGNSSPARRFSIASLAVPWKFLRSGWENIRELMKIKDVAAGTCPQTDTVLLSLIYLFIFITISVIAVRFPTKTVKYVVIATSSVLVCTLGVTVVIDVVTRKRRVIRRSLLNTVLTVILTIAILTALYSQIWYQGLNDIVIRLETDQMRIPQFPAIAFFQGQIYGQARIYLGELKCSSGPRDDHAVQCSSLNIPEALSTVSCDCGDNWPGLDQLQRGENTMMWLGQNTSYYSMVPSQSTVSKGAGHFLEVQIFFTYNSTEAFWNASLTPAPGIWMAIYDPSYDIAQMAQNGQLYTAQVDANSHTVVNIGLKYNTYLDKSPNYKYDVTVSTRQNLDLVCDISTEDWWPCHFTVEMQITSFLRTVVHEERKQDWTRVVADAGAYFALVQFLCWIASGMAWS